MSRRRHAAGSRPGLTLTELEGLFFLDDADRDLIVERRRDENRIGFGLQVATVQALEARSVDDALELFDVLMTTELLSRAERQSRKEKLRCYPKVSWHAGKLVAAVAVLLEAAEWGEQVRLEQVWDVPLLCRVIEFGATRRRGAWKFTAWC
ncbi:DUF4158 domain-containing protein [Micromonospora zamorensis]